MQWSAEDVARATVRRQATGLSAGQVADKVAEAALRERETQRELRSPTRYGEDEPDPFQSDPQKLAEQWAARHAEWQRVAALMAGEGWTVYDPDRDTPGTAWDQDREARRIGALARHTAWRQEQADARDELRTQVWLTADAGRRVREIAARTGLSPEQLLAQLAAHAELRDDGTLAAGPFTPQ
ncbi:hypothetical protein ACIPSE_46640 [Streptomyces sp. NPDC090106]|uniref:hypothetical protein n=1 Tax=Streptomyces sp. NPDC090106 TaxID=3365946 RepID=UPI00381675C9